MDRSRPSVWLAAFFVGLTALSGCGSGAGKFAVRGKLQYEDGSPLTDLAGFEITFTSEALAKGSRGDIQADGSFEMSTTGDNDGVIPGEYKVTVSQPHVEPGRPETRNPFVELIYEDPAKTPLHATVQANNDNFFTFKLERIKKGPRKGGNK
jgi:hypothetical protein